ncbi:zf-HC2 domain-containing protein [Sphaerisporangium sp. B11E5]|uniref:zf-HC2 domain-containing protein n=1 Tax=Sphaerisporangium sp. B11E5 TaxID=3153563 RepID=UPI00325E03EB
MSGTWHVDTDLLERYVSSRLDPVTSMSIETHLTRCERCRNTLPREDAWLSRSWAAIEDTIGRPRLTVIERTLRRLGVPEHMARLLAATPMLSRAWLLGVAAVLTFAVAAAHWAPAHPAALLPFLVAAPVSPLVGVAIAYAPRIDAAHEMLAATPMAGSRLLLVRTGAVLVTATPLAAATMPFLPAPPVVTVAWLCPGLALVTACLALSVRVPVRTAAPLLVVAWLIGVFAAGQFTGDRLLPFQPPAQMVYGTTAAVLAVFVYLRRSRLDAGGTR